jgi:hypothetical protein
MSVAIAENNPSNVFMLSSEGCKKVLLEAVSCWIGLVVDEAGLEPLDGAAARTSADVAFACGDDILTGLEI